MSKVSIIIVSYNVKKFLQLCLNSVFKSNTNLEVIVVDNHSEDGTSEMIQAEYPDVRYFPIQQNLGFGKACNKGLVESTGEYVLFLNPDTVIQEDTISLCQDFYSKVDKPGIVGVKMVDGSGKFLPESKRGFPDMMSSFWKMSGIASIFSKSKFFNHYYLGHLSQDENNEVDILCGAFMFMHRRVLEAVGSFDESFFMYGEDIDLSYRVLQGGYKNYYLADSTIIHYKGQSTKKEDLSYVKYFYSAMAIFSSKHVSGSKGKLQMHLLNLAIQLRKAVSVVKRLVQSLLRPLLEGIVLLSGFYYIQRGWGKYHFDNVDYYATSPIVLNICAYTLIWLCVFAWNKMYSRHSAYSRSNVFLSVISGAIVILVFYSLMPESFRTSRALIGFFSVWAFCVAYILRVLPSLIQAPAKREKRIGFVGSEVHFNAFRKIVNSNFSNETFIRHIPATEILNVDDIRHIDQLNEVVFSFKDIKLDAILKTMTTINNIEFKIFGSDGLSAIGSKAKSIPGETYSEKIEYAITDDRNRSLKRILDLFLGLILMVLSPFLSFFTRSSLGTVWSKLMSVILGKLSLVGYNTFDQDVHVLPTMKSGLIQVGIDNYKDQQLSHKYNADYAMYYSLWRDIQIITRQWKNI